MKATITQLQNSAGVLQEVLACPRVPAKAVYAVTKLINAMNPELEAFGKARDRVFQEHGCVVVGNTWANPEQPEALSAALVEIADLANQTEVELNALQLDPEQFGNAEIPGNTFMVLAWAMKEE